MPWSGYILIYIKAMAVSQVFNLNETKRENCLIFTTCIDKAVIAR